MRTRSKKMGYRFMSRTIAIALAFGMIGSAAFAATPGRQLVGPNFNPGLKSVPSVASPHYAGSAACDQQLVSRIDSGTVIAGPDGLVAHLTGMALGVTGGNAQLVVTSMTPDGQTANADFVACRSTVVVDSPSPVATSMNLPLNNAPQSIIVRAEANSMVLYTSKAR